MAKIAASATQTALQMSASRYFTVWVRRWKTPKSSTSIATTKTLNSTQNSINQWPRLRFRSPDCTFPLATESTNLVACSCCLTVLILSPPLAAFPTIPHAECLQLLIHMSFAKGLFNLGVVEARAGPHRGVGDTQGQCSRFGDVFFELGQIDLVKRIGHGVVVDQVVVLLLVGNERWHALKQEIKVVGAPVRVSGEAASMRSRRPPNEKPVTRPVPESKITTPTAMSSSALWVTV